MLVSVKSLFNSSPQLIFLFPWIGGEEGRDVCTGDGGSPLMCSIEDNSKYFYQAGIVVAGIGCGQKSVPAIYTDVSKFRDWIDEKMTLLELGSNSYTF